MPMPSDELIAFKRIAALIDTVHTVAISGHTDPDGDALGSVLALTGIIESRWPGVRVQPLLANDRPVMAAYRFLPGADRLMPAAAYDAVPDLFISVDTPMPERLCDARAVLERAPMTAAFDHHPTMEPFAQVNCLRASAASVGDIICDFMDFLEVEPSPEVATAILTAVLTDTGRFQYQNTNAHALEVAAAMVAAGASCAEVSESVYQSYSLPALKLRERALAHLGTDEHGLIAYSYVTQEDLTALGATAEDCDSLIDVPRSLRGAKGCLFLREQVSGSVRGSVRSKVDWLDVSAVAQRFGGGGHRAAAGFTAQGPITAVLEAAVQALLEQVAIDEAKEGVR